MVVRNLEACSLQSVVCRSEKGMIAERGIAFISHLSNSLNLRSDPSEDNAWTSNSISQVFFAAAHAFILTLQVLKNGSFHATLAFASITLVPSMPESTIDTAGGEGNLGKMLASLCL